MKREMRWGAGFVLIGGAACALGYGRMENKLAEPSASQPLAMESTPAAMPRLASKSSPDAAGSAGGEESPKLTLAKYRQSEPDRYLIKNAVITVETAEVRGGAKQLAELAKAEQGYVSDSHEAVDGIGSRSVTMTVRVPAVQFENTTLRIEALGKIQDKQVTAEDVTEEFVDTTARTRNLKKSEERLLVHLTHTGKLSDTLAIENELTRVREEVEKTEGRLRFLGHRIAYSTFNVTFRETAHAQTITPAETFSSGKIATDAGRNLIGFLQSVWGCVIWLGIWAIVWLPPVALLIWSLRRQRRGRQHSVGVPAPPPLYDIKP